MYRGCEKAGIQEEYEQLLLPLPPPLLFLLFFHRRATSSSPIYFLPRAFTLFTSTPHERHIAARSLDVIMGVGCVPFFAKRRHFGSVPAPAITASAVPHLTYCPKTLLTISLL